MLSGNLNSQHYHDKILQDILLQCQCLAYPNKDNIFQQDNAPCYNSISTRRYIADAGVRLLDWSGNSPDLSPIENILNVIKKRTGKLPLTKDSGLIFREYGLAPEKNDLEPCTSLCPVEFKQSLKLKVVLRSTE